MSALAAETAETAFLSMNSPLPRKHADVSQVQVALLGTQQEYRDGDLF